MFGLIPKEEKFFLLFKEMTTNIIEGANLLKDMLDNFLRHPCSGIGYRYFDVLAGSYGKGTGFAVSVIQLDIGGCKRNNAAFRHGVAGVESQIQQCILQ